MKSRYFVVKTLNGEKKFARVSDEMTSDEFKKIFIDVAKEVHPII